MNEFSTRTSIAADPARVWSILVDTDRWPDWDDRLERVEGALTAGGGITIHVQESKRPFVLKVRTWEPNVKLVLSGGMPLGLFTGTREYELTEADGETEFSMSEHYTGLLAPIFTRSIPDLQPSFDAFAAGLRRAAAS